LLRNSDMAAPRFIYHIVFTDEWDRQKDNTIYSTSNFEDEGFIHCSKVEQISGTLKRFFRNRTDIRILKIDTTLLDAPVLYEAADDGSGFFPHIFGSICMQAIVEVEMPQGYRRGR
jgi:uncharacterized protein (DUF952 family)